jgi:twinkle protein
MRFYAIEAKEVFDFTGNGKQRLVCPVCSKDRKKKSEKCLHFDFDKNIGFCHHCNERYVEHKDFEKEEQYTQPKWVNFTELSDKTMKWFEGRLIGKAVIQKMNVSSKKVFMPQRGKEVDAIAFPFYKGGELINVKYRDGAKNFKLESGAEVTWYNHKSIKENQELIITEGEIDALSFMQCGFDNVISVPNGANPNLPFLKIEEFEHLQTIYLATDHDKKGLELRDELLRRLGPERCLICQFEQFKDANEYLANKGHDSLKTVIKNAKEPSIEGVFKVSDFEKEIDTLWEFGLQPGKTIDIPELDELITWETKRLCVWTGIPGSGKSEVLDLVNVKLNLEHGWKCAYWSPENFPISYHYAKLSEKILGTKFNKSKTDSASHIQGKEYIDDNFFWVAPEKDYTLDNILKKAEFLVRSKGIKVFVLDPFNKIENEVEYKQQGKLLDKMLHFAKHNDVLFHLVAHPKKLVKEQSGKYPVPTMYDISGSADFWNKTDYGIAVYREQNELGLFENFGGAIIQKVKFKHLGKQGEWNWKYNYNNGRFEEKIGTIEGWDNKNWLTPNIEKAEFNKGMHTKDFDHPF